MNNAAITVTEKMMNPVVVPTSKVLLRRRFPRWKFVNTFVRVHDGEKYIERPDAVMDTADGNITKCYLDAPGDFIYSFGGWMTAIPGDSDFSEDIIARVYTPASLNDMKYGHTIFIYKTTNGSSWGGEELSTPWYSIMPSLTSSDWDIKFNSRPGIFVNGEDVYVYYHALNNKIVCISYVDGVWRDLYAASSTMDVAGYPVAVAPVGIDDVVTYYYDGRTKAYRLGRWTNGIKQFENMLATFHRDDERTGYEFHAFDAEKLSDTQVLVVANNSMFGNSKSYFIYGGHVSDPQIILPSDDVDWTGTLLVHSLSKVNTEVGPKLFAVATQRFMQGNGYYSAPLTTAIWSAATSDTHWAQARYLPITLHATAGKICTLDDGVFVVSPATVMRGDRTADFGGSGNNVQRDISSAVDSWSMTMSNGNATSIKHKITTSGHPLFDSSDWMSMADEVVTWVGVEETSGSGITSEVSTLLMIGEVVNADNSMTVTTGKIPFTSRGPIGKMVAGVQFTDEILTRAIDERFSMDENTMINAGNSTWYAKDGWIITAFPNKNGESFALNSSPIRSSFFLKAAFKYDENSSSAGFIFWADTKDYEAGGDYPAHNHYVFRLDEAEVGSTQKWPHLYRRTGTRDANGEWTDSLQLIKSGAKISLSTDKSHYFVVQFIGGELRVMADWEDDPILVWAPDRIIPKEYLCGIYAKTRRTTTTKSQMPGTIEIELDNVSDWPNSGKVKIGKVIYGYNKKDSKTLILDRGLDTFLVDGAIVSPADNTVRFDWFQVNSSDMRYSVADVFRHVAARSGVYAHVDRAFYLTDMKLVYGSYSHVGETYKINSSDTLFLSDELLTNALFKVRYDGLVTGSELHIRLQRGSEQGGFGINFQKGTGANDWAHLMFYDGSVTDLSEGESVFKNPISHLPETGWIRCVVQEGFIHIYINDTFLTSLYTSKLINLSWKVGVGGKSIDILDVLVDIGASVMLPGIWDSTTQAKRIITNMLKGRPLTFVDNSDGTVRLLRTYKHDDLGPMKLDHVFDLAYGKVWGQPGSALLLQGGYDWSISFNEEMLTDTGLVWENRENHTLMSQGAMLQYARIALAENESMARGYAWTSRLDPRMMPNDSFSVQSHKSMPDGDYVATKVQHSYLAPKGDKAPSAMSSGTARRKET